MFTIIAINPVMAQDSNLKNDADYLDPQLGFYTVFTPDVNGTQIYIDWLEVHCHKTLYVAIYTLTDPLVVNEYVLLAKRGVDVHVILDASEERAVKKEGQLITDMAKAGCEVIITTSEKKHALMHAKMTIADGEYVEDGSWNYTPAANNQVNYLNFNISPSARRAEIFMKAWTELANYAKNNK